MSKSDLEDRTTEFAKEVIKLCKLIKRDPINDRIIGQIVRSSGSIGANYREANDSLGKKDFIHKLMISRKECKETLHWIELLIEANQNVEEQASGIKEEAIELRNILSAIINKAISKE